MCVCVCVCVFKLQMDATLRFQGNNFNANTPQCYMYTACRINSKPICTKSCCVVRG